jgi:hypothetical protein
LRRRLAGEKPTDGNSRRGTFADAYNAVMARAANMLTVSPVIIVFANDAVILHIVARFRGGQGIHSKRAPPGFAFGADTRTDILRELPSRASDASGLVPLLWAFCQFSPFPPLTLERIVVFFAFALVAVPKVQAPRILRLIVGIA